jgi:hypothetical protein
MTAFIYFLTSSSFSGFRCALFSLEGAHDTIIIAMMKITRRFFCILMIKGFGEMNLKRNYLMSLIASGLVYRL